jgi:imidazolonepropionase-like amidohydrolase
MSVTIVGAKVFDGFEVIEVASVTIEDGVIVDLDARPSGKHEVLEAAGATLLPGLIDAHVHTDVASLRLALRFGVTTELEMQGVNTRGNRDHITGDDAVADVRSSGFAITPPGGHPSELFPKNGGERGGGPVPGAVYRDAMVRPHATTTEEAVDFVGQLVEAGSDYIKFMVDDGTVEGHPGLPYLDGPTLAAGISEASRRSMLTIAHALTVDATQLSVDSGVHGLAHLFMDRPHTPEVITAIAKADVFVIACVCLDASMMGITGARFADDPRVAGRLNSDWDTTLRSSFNRYPQGNLEDVLASVAALHAAGVDILVGTDASQPLPFLGGLAHGASVHQELQYLVQAGLSPVEALRAATSTTAERFGLSDRGRIQVGARADLLLVDGDPTTTIADTLNIREVWRGGVRQPTGA